MKLRSSLTLKLTDIKIGITIGDPSGVGPSITLKALKILYKKARFFVIGDKWVLEKIAFKAGKEYRDILKSKHIKIIDIPSLDYNRFKQGIISTGSGRASLNYIDKALELIDSKEIDCLVNCPVSKEAITRSGVRFIGHTEYLAKHSKVKEYVMMLLNDKLRFSLITRHIPLKEVSSRINSSVIKSNILLTNGFLRDSLGIKNPRIVVCGLNPHASDNGIIGKEENGLIRPFLNKIRHRYKINLIGPQPSDVAIYKALNQEYDCVIAFYHDQALIPLKLTGINKGVNITIGLGYIRTSPLHGTAFDIAADFKNCNPSSLVASINTALKCTYALKRD